MVSSLVNSSVVLPSTKIILNKSICGLAEINARYQLPSTEMQHQAKLALLRSLKKTRTNFQFPINILPSLHLFLLLAGDVKPVDSYSKFLFHIILSTAVDCHGDKISAPLPAALVPLLKYYNSSTANSSTHLPFWSSATSTT